MSHATPHVLLFAPEDDGHALVVRDELARLGAEAKSVSLTSVLDTPLAIDPGVVAEFGGTRVDASWTVWWRRTGSVPPAEGMAELEQRIRAEEAQALVVGGLLAVRPRWVDDPHVVQRAEHSLLQLAVAREVGAPVPDAVATSDPVVATSFLAAGPCVVKATSSGVGIAPYADVMSPDLVDLLPAAPTLLQRRLVADADLRVVVLNGDAMVWSRPHARDEPLDWRAADPTGDGFRKVEDPGVGGWATAVSARLGLSFCVQDWLLAYGKAWFLEVNPVGQWLFLRDARDIIAPKLAAHLVAGTVP